MMLWQSFASLPPFPSTVCRDSRFWCTIPQSLTINKPAPACLFRPAGESLLAVSLRLSCTCTFVRHKEKSHVCTTKLLDRFSLPFRTDRHGSSAGHDGQHHGQRKGSHRGRGGRG